MLETVIHSTSKKELNRHLELMDHLKSPPRLNLRKNACTLALCIIKITPNKLLVNWIFLWAIFELCVKRGFLME